MSTTEVTDEVLAFAGIEALIEAASEVGIELPDPEAADVAPWSAVDPGELVGDAPHGWTVATFAPTPEGTTAGAATVVATAGAARLVVAYVRARGWRAETRPHVVADGAEVTSRER